MLPLPTSGIQFDKVHAITLVAAATIQANRFIAYDGTHATTSDLTQCVSESAANVGEAFSGVTSYSYPVQASEALALGDYVRPASDGSGRAAKGTAADHCARALHAITSGRLVECELTQGL